MKKAVLLIISWVSIQYMLWYTGVYQQYLFIRVMSLIISIQIGMLLNDIIRRGD